MVEHCHRILREPHFRQRKQKCQRGFRALICVDAVHMQRIAAAAGVGGIQLQAEIVPAKKPIEGALRVFMPNGIGHAQRAFDWFLGWNDLGLELYSSNTGGCRDGLHADRSNENQGAESMLAFLLSLAEMRLIQNTATGVQRAGLAASMTQ